MTKFIAFAVDMSGTPEARYDLVANDAEAAEQEARQYLERHRGLVDRSSAGRADREAVRLAGRIAAERALSFLNFLNGAPRQRRPHRCSEHRATFPNTGAHRRDRVRTGRGHFVSWPERSLHVDGPLQQI